MNKNLFILLLIVPVCLSAQNETPKYYDGEYKMYNEVKVKHYIHIDYNFYYEVMKPGWFKEIDTNSAYIWRGNLPVVNGITDRITITCFGKDDFDSYGDFVNYIDRNLEFGKSPEWDQHLKCAEKKNLGNYKNFGPSYNLIFYYNGHEFFHQYVLLESKTACILVDFKSTTSTFKINYPRFEEFMNGFKITN